MAATTPPFQKRRRARHLPVARFVALFLVLSLGPLALLAYSSSSLGSDAVGEQARARLRSTAAVSANSVDKELSGVAELVQSYASRRGLVSALTEGRPERYDRTAVAFHLSQLKDARPGLATVFLVEPGGRLVDILPSTPSVVGRDFSIADWYRAVTTTGRPYVSEAHQSAAAGQPRVVAAAVPVWARREERLAGILVAAVGIESIQRMTEEVAGAQGVRLTVTDQRGAVVAAPSSVAADRVPRPDDPRIRAALAGRAGMMERSASGEQVLSAYSPVNRLGWAVVAEVPRSEAFAAVSEMRSKVLAMAAGLALVLLAGVVFLGFVLRSRRRAELVLRQSEERTRAILEAAGDAFVSMDATGVITGWNAQAEATFGWPRSEVMGLQLTETIVPPEYRAAHRRGLRRFLETGQGPILNQRIEMPAKRRDGEEFPAELVVWAVRSGEAWDFNAFVRDITERKRTEQALAEAKEQAMEASQLKSEFLANMSHEIRTPLNGVIGMTDLLLGTAMDAEQRDHVETIQSSGEVLMSLLNDILDLSKIEAGKLDIEVVDLDPRAVVEEVAQLLAKPAGDKGLELATFVDPQLPAMLAGDPTRLRQVLLNLVGNAVKFTEVGEVVVTARQVEQAGGVVTVRFEVRDTGPGIPPSERGRLFESFSQADASTTRRHGGTGLGLAISKQLVRLMGGEIGVDSEVGHGTTFWFTARLETRPDASPAQPTPAPPEVLPGLRVLVVDDTSSSRTLLEETLRAWGMAATCVTEGEQALAMLEEATRRGTPYQVAILDHHMAGLTGLELARAIAAHPGIAAPHLVLLTSTAQRGEAEAAREAGVHALLAKPVRQSALGACLAQAVGAATTMDDSPSGPEPAPATTAATTVLVVDDNAVNRKVAAHMLERLGHEVDLACNGREAVEAASRKRYGAVLMDCQMPEMDGFEATREIRRREGGRCRTPVIAMTAGAMRSEQDSCRAAGMDDYVAKPMVTQDLEAALARCLGSGPGPGAAAGADRDPEPADQGSAPAGPASREQEVVEEARWAMLRRLGADSVLEEVVRSFFADADDSVASMREALARGDVSGVRQGAHFLAGSSGNLGASRLHQVSSRLERAILSGAQPPPLAVDEVEAELRRAEAALGRLLAEARA